jgi:putative flippase GtrA
MSTTFARFCLVGVINTLIDVPLFVALHSAAGLSILLANIISTSLALCVSLALNRRYTFRTGPLRPGRLAIFFLVTLSGIWVVQPLVIDLLLNLNSVLHFTAPLVSLLGHANAVNSLAAKLGSLLASLLWNYAWYSKVVFERTNYESYDSDFRQKADYRYYR